MTTNNMDIKRFDDKVAEQTHWHALEVKSGSFNLFNLHTEDPYKLEYKRTGLFKLFISVFVMFGCILILPALLSVVVNVLVMGLAIRWFDFVSYLLVAMIFFGGAWRLVYHSQTPPLFNLRQLLFTRGRGSKKVEIDCSDIHALQLLAHYVGQHKGNYTTYQLNLVLNNGSREHVVGYSTPKVARRDAQTIAKNIDVKIWDVIDD